MPSSGEGKRKKNENRSFTHRHASCNVHTRTALKAVSSTSHEDNRGAFRPEERVDGGWKEGSWPNLIERQMNGSIDSKVRAFERPLTSVQTENRRAHREA